MKSFISFSILLLVFLTTTVFSQLKDPSKNVPKYSISVMAGYDYAFGNANGDPTGFSEFYDNNIGKNVFSARNYGMQQGVSIAALGKMAMDRKKQLRMTGTVGYTLFYNTQDGGANRTKWSIFTLGAGVEYSLRPWSKSSPFIRFDVDYNLMFGGWQTDVTFPDNTMSNIYVKFQPASRIGISLGTGADFKMNSKTSFTVGIRGVWANIAPKGNSYSVSGYDTYINDSGNSNGITYNSSKQVIFMQIFSGLNFSLF